MLSQQQMDSLEESENRQTNWLWRKRIIPCWKWTSPRLNSEEKSFAEKTGEVGEGNKLASMDSLPWS
jgi:hypothetical protein